MAQKFTKFTVLEEDVSRIPECKKRFLLDNPERMGETIHDYFIFKRMIDYYLK